MRSIFISLFLIIFSYSTFANFSFNQNCKTAYSKMMLFDFEGAHRILENEKRIHPSNLIPEYIETYMLFWKAALNEEEEDMDIYEERVDDLIDLIEDDEQKSPFKNFLLSDVYLRGAYIKGMQTSYMSAAYKFNKAYNLVQKNRTAYPQFIPNKKLIGLMNVGIGTVPKKYSWVLKLFNFEGNVQEGIRELEELLNITATQESYHYLLSESLLLYSFSMQNFEVSAQSNQKLLTVFNWKIIKEELPNNQAMTFAKAEFLKHIKHTDEAIKCIQSVKEIPGAMHFYYLDYLLGQCLVSKLDYSSARYFSKYMNEFHGNSYRRAACQKLAWNYLLQGNKSKYKTTINSCLNFGNDNRDADRQATKEAESEQIPNTYLLKARLLFDGGYYQKASALLQTSNKKSYTERNQLEHIYRLARIYDEWGKTALAITNYKDCVAKGEDKEYYYAANSALHLGYIYEKKGQIALAKTMYEECLDMDYDEYQDGISQKAKAALERIED